MVWWREALSWGSGNRVLACPCHCPMGWPWGFHLAISAQKETPTSWEPHVGAGVYSAGRAGSEKVGREEGRAGGLLTAVSLVQAIGAVLDPITGGHTESVHRAEELSRTSWGRGGAGRGSH